MSKVVYLFGAGASSGTLPVVKEMASRLEELANLISSRDYLLHEHEKFDGVPEGSFQSKRKHQEDLINGLKELKRICMTHYSIDTFAKKLSIIGDEKGLNKLKILLSFFFTAEQIRRPPDARYDYFFASILHSINDLPNIKILSWNYDNQFEIAFSEFSRRINVSENQRLLHICHKTNPVFLPEENQFGIFKLNGSTEFGGGMRLMAFNVTTKIIFTQELLEDMIKNYVIFTYVKGFFPLFSFAWEDTANTSFSSELFNQIRDAEILIVIGYSFPYFNRSIDKLILTNMQKLRKVYFQSPEADNLVVRFKSIRNDISSDNLLPENKDIDYFFVPDEM